MKPSVLVLMATYNGEQYIREQLDSILKQEGVDVFVQIADDKSTDKTISILNEYKTKHSNIDYYINTKNLGFTYNFINLIFSAKNQHYDYYALSDQDDVWESNKLIKAIEKIKTKQHKNGVLYCSNLKLVNNDLKELGHQENKNVLKTKKYSFLISNIATGCTIVFNNDFKNHILQYYPNEIYLHDYWLFLIAVFTAEFVYDYNSYVLYRQHNNNLIGSNKRFSLSKKTREAFDYPNRTSNLIKEFYKGYAPYISNEDNKCVYLAGHYNDSLKNKLKLLFSTKIRKRNKDILFRIKVLFNKY